MDNELWVILLPIVLLPVFFAMGWFAARVDMKTVLKQAKSIPAGFYKSLDALVDRNSGRAARELAEVIDQQPQSYDLNLTLGKLYRQRGENDKAINMHRALLDSPDTVNEKRARVLFENARACFLNWRKTTKVQAWLTAPNKSSSVCRKAIWHVKPANTF